jgi:RNA polymerase subunit RPABC4/transcription elongation factor Spt4
MVRFKHPCRHCGQLAPPDAGVCPMCGKVNPEGPRCPKCRAPIQTGWTACPSCGLALQAVCPECLASVFFDDYCSVCGARLVVRCPHPKCRAEQPPLGGPCVRCGKPMTQGE